MIVIVFQLSQDKKPSSKQVVRIIYTPEKKVIELSLLKVCGTFLFRQMKKTRDMLWSVRVFFALLEVSKTMEYYNSMERRNKYCL